MASCIDKVEENTVKPVVNYEYKTIYKVVKTTKEVTKQQTDYTYKYDWLNGKFRQQPDISTTTNYFVGYTDGSVEQITLEKFLFYKPGDTASITIKIPHYSIDTLKK